jgi:hypothetical protein
MNLREGTFGRNQCAAGVALVLLLPSCSSPPKPAPPSSWNSDWKSLTHEWTGGGEAPATASQGLSIGERGARLAVSATILSVDLPLLISVTGGRKFWQIVCRSDPSPESCSGIAYQVNTKTIHVVLRLNDAMARFATTTPLQVSDLATGVFLAQSRPTRVLFDLDHGAALVPPAGGDAAACTMGEGDYLAVREIERVTEDVNAGRLTDAEGSQVRSRLLGFVVDMPLCR